MGKAFQFPSNGKAETKLSHPITKRIELVVYCFNSLQTGKQIGMSRKPSAESHYSIPFKRESRSKEELPKQRVVWMFPQFQFPSNGKVDTKEYVRSPAIRLDSFNSLQTGRCSQRGDAKWLVRYSEGEWVSIPFKREGVAKAYQTKRGNYRILIVWFQFPSNGKV